VRVSDTASKPTEDGTSGGESGPTEDGGSGGEAKQTGGDGSGGAKHSVDDRWLLAAAVAVSLATFAFVAASLSERRAFGAAVIGTALLVLLVIIVARRQWVRTSAAIVLTLVVVIGGALIIWGPSAWLGLTQEASITMINPSPDNPSPQPGCVAITFSGTPPTGYVYVVANREHGSSRYFFQGQVSQDPATDDWTSNIQIGQTSKADGGHTFYIYIYIMDKSFADYMTNAVPLNGASNWSSLVPPPDATAVGGITVIRNHGNQTCHSGP
jgi:hypothetical protein